MQVLLTVFWHLSSGLPLQWMQPSAWREAYELRAGDDLVATLRWGNEWDIAAAALIAEEGGACVTDATGRTLAFNTPEARAFGVVTSTRGIHAAALERLAPRAAAVMGRAA